MIEQRSFKTVLAAALVLASTSAYGASDKNGYVGALLGTSLANTGGSNSTMTGNSNFGLQVGAKLVPEFGIGFYGTTSGQRNSASVFGLPAGTETRNYALAGEANIFASVFHAGVNLGVGINTWSANIGSAQANSSNTAFIYGPEAGFDIPLGQSMVSLGGEVHYLLTTESEGKNNLQLLGALKMWL